MYRIGLAVLGCLLLACNGNEGKEKEKSTAKANDSQMDFTARFKKASLPYQIADSDLLKNADTTTLAPADIMPLIPDSTTKQLFGKSTKIKYTPLAKLAEKEKDVYCLVKATSGTKRAALLLVFDKSGEHGATLPFLVPDSDPSTTQVSSIDKSYSITKSTTQRTDNAVTGEGKEVLEYNPKEKNFTLTLTDLLNDNPAVLVNPIDTFRRTNKLAGDYWAGKKNLVAVRDGRHNNQILVYIHTENSEGDCKGELKGEAILTSTTTAVYRQGGDPCVLGLGFSGNTVSIHEESGCGNHRGLDCPLSGSFTRKKEEGPKQTNAKSKRPKRSGSVTTTQ